MGRWKKPGAEKLKVTFEATVGWQEGKRIFGIEDEAEEHGARGEVLRLNPQFSLPVHRQRTPIKDPAVLERHLAALRKAGLRSG